jgi:hypothetical protein
VTRHVPLTGASTLTIRPQFNLTSSSFAAAWKARPSGPAMSTVPPLPSNVIENVTRVIDGSMGTS